MTRINVVPVSELTTKHLIAEYRELPRIPGNLKKSLNRKSKPFSKTEIPNEYVLGKGHVKFFYNKLRFLENRHKELVREMQNRGFNPKFTNPESYYKISGFYGDYKPTKEALSLNRKRIEKRLSKINITEKITK